MEYLFAALVNVIGSIPEAFCCVGRCQGSRSPAPSPIYPFSRPVDKWFQAEPRAPTTQGGVTSLGTATGVEIGSRFAIGHLQKN